MLTQRDLLFSGDIPGELNRERQVLRSSHDRVLSELARLDANADQAEVGTLLDRLMDVRENQQRLRERIKVASPRWATLQYPAPLSVAGASRALDQGTVLLAYAVGDRQTLLFVLGPEAGKLDVRSLPVGEQDLGKQARQLGTAVRARRPLHRRASALSAVLLEPARREIEQAERVLIAADGPLHLVPFGLLADGVKDDLSSVCLLENKPLHFVYSMTVYSELASRRRTGASSRLLALGDPVYGIAGDEVPGASEHPGGLGRPVLGVRRLEPLPASREEVLEIARLYGEDATVWLGPDATEAKLRRPPARTSVVHVACHALIDDWRPLESALALSPPDTAAGEQGNGLLQAWEILEELRLDADLVVLSACETGTGQSVRGEGLIGLTRAFQYAGARSVVASLWSVPDATTAKLMGRFHHRLARGDSKDVALQQAQVSFIRSPIRDGDGEDGIERDLSHPFYWAAFQLVGDWR